ncbi:MAG: menaquinol-cytochrome c reductase cytochrome b subunit [Actinomycetota bacterium]
MAESPDEVYERILAEEQAKGSSPAVAEARAKAARHRARKGIPIDPAGAAAAAAGAPATASASPPARASTSDSSDTSTSDASTYDSSDTSTTTADTTPEGAAPSTQAQEAPAAAAAVAAAAPAAAVAVAAAGPQGRRAAARAAGGAGGPAPERIQRLLAVVKPESIQRVEREPIDRVNTWPHLMAGEFVAMLVVTAFLVIYSTFINAPFRELANINSTPNPSKAPWYFLGLQELLRYFHPQIAGVTIPQWIILGLMAAPYIDRNPSNKPSDRKLAIVMFTLFILFFAVLTILGSLFRGPGFNFIYPWKSGIYFEL